MRLERNAEPIRAACDAGLLSGAVTLVWQGGRVRQVNEIGHRDVAAGLPMTRDTIFRIASMTKPITVAAAMSLVDAGRLALGDPISRWLPEFARPTVLLDPTGPLDRTAPAQRELTIEDLLTHRSGIGYGFTVTGEIARAYLRLPFGAGPDAWTAALAELPLVHQPGAAMTYGQSIDLLGVLLSRLEGKPLATVLAERVTGPLGMADTGFQLSVATRRRAATMYRIGRDGALHDDAMGPPPIVEPAFPNAGGGLFSTVDDYLRFAAMLLGDGCHDGVRVLSAASAAAMRTDRLTPAQKSKPFLGSPFWVGRGFGLNLSVVTDPAAFNPLFGPGGLGSFGWPGAYGTWWQADPAADVILIYLVQNHPSLHADAAAAVAGDASLAALSTARPKFVRASYAGLGC